MDPGTARSEEHTSELQSPDHLVCRLLLEKKKKIILTMNEIRDAVCCLLLFPYLTVLCLALLFFFFFNDTATTEIYTLSLHDALPICRARRAAPGASLDRCCAGCALQRPSASSAQRHDTVAWTLELRDRKSTRLNSSHQIISYAVFCLKKKKK